METNKLILKIMALYNKVNKEELIATLCTMDEEFQETITAMIEECSTRQNSPERIMSNKLPNEAKSP